MIGRNQTERSHERWKKIGIPLLAGEDTDRWANTIERYFHLRGLQRERIYAAMVAMEEHTLSGSDCGNLAHQTPVGQSSETPSLGDFNHQ